MSTSSWGSLNFNLIGNILGNCDSPVWNRLSRVNKNYNKASKTDSVLRSIPFSPINIWHILNRCPPVITKVTSDVDGSISSPMLGTVQVKNTLYFLGSKNKLNVPGEMITSYESQALFATASQNCLQLVDCSKENSVFTIDFSKFLPQDDLKRRLETLPLILFAGFISSFYFITVLYGGPIYLWGVDGKLVANLTFENSSKETISLCSLNNDLLTLICQNHLVVLKCLPTGFTQVTRKEFKDCTEDERVLLNSYHLKSDGKLLYALHEQGQTTHSIRGPYLKRANALIKPTLAVSQFTVEPTIVKEATTALQNVAQDQIASWEVNNGFSAFKLLKDGGRVSSYVLYHGKLTVLDHRSNTSQKSWGVQHQFLVTVKNGSCVALHKFARTKRVEKVIDPRIAEIVSCNLFPNKIEICATFKDGTGIYHFDFNFLNQASFFEPHALSRSNSHLNLPATQTLEEDVELSPSQQSVKRTRVDGRS